MKLSILDQAPILSGKSAQEALHQSVLLAKKGEELGYSRYWIAEHHDLNNLACSAPEIMLAYIGSQTETIRIGAGAILLPYYKPYKIAEVFNMLETLFPGRIDLGIGRAPGGPAEASLALSDHYLKGVWNLPHSLEELLHFLNYDFPKDHQFSNLQASPRPVDSPRPWLLGTSRKSAKLAAENGMAYAFAHFMSDVDGPSILSNYRENYKQRFGTMETIVAVSVICAERTEKAEELALDWYKKTHLNEQELKDDKALLSKMNKKMVIGNREEVGEKLTQLQHDYCCDELMINTNVDCFESRLKSYQLIVDLQKA